MCGIVGILTQKSTLSTSELSSQLQNMQECVSYRGPDDSGDFVQEGIALGHRRLSILDLSQAGHQPMVTADGTCVLVFNGEIYNFRELKDRYLSDLSFVSHSDTEVLLYLLQRQGLKALHHLRGMFSFAFWNSVSQELLLARDPFGKKPLYYLEEKGIFAFASEPKALLARTTDALRVDADALPQYLLHEYIPTPRTAWKGICQLGMGQSAIITKEKVDISTWWKPVFSPKQSVPFEKAASQFDELLRTAVTRRMVSDVPVGLFLSGGIDSTSILWYMKDLGVKDLHSCSISFTQQTFDETEHIRLASSHLGSTHHEMQFDVETFLRVLPEVVQKMDIPLADASLLPTYAVSEMAKKYMKVVLSGDGADELLGGYGTFTAAAVGEAIGVLPSTWWEKATQLAALLPVSHTYFSFDFKVKSFLKGMSYSQPERNQVWLGSFTPPEIKRLLMPSYEGALGEVWESIEDARGELSSLSLFDQISLMTIRNYLQDDILVKLDRATMFHSLEARTPFLDVDLANFLFTLPSKYKQNKRILKAVMRGRIPDQIIDRPKKGFGIPLGQWLIGPLKEWARDVLSQEKVEAAGFWRWEEVDRLFNEHVSLRADHRKKLWTLLMWQLWWEAWVKK